MKLSAKKRDLSANINSLRKEGFIPAELYGHGFENEHLIIPVKEFTKVFKESGESMVITIEVEGDKEPYNVLIHEVVNSPLSGEFEHIDFYRLHMDEKTTAHVEIIFIGESPAVKEKRGLLIKGFHEVEVEALPADLPHEIEVDVSGLNEVGDAIHVADLKISPKVKILTEPETVIVSITELVKEEVAAPVETETAEVKETEAPSAE